MKKLVLAASIAAIAIAVPAQAHRPDGSQGQSGAAAGTYPGEQADGAGKGNRPDHPKGHPGPGAAKGAAGDHPGKRRGRCTPRRVGYVAAGLYVESALTQTQGADTPDNRRDDRWSGTLTVDVKRTNRHAQADKGTTKTYTLTDAQVRFADTNADGTRDVPAAGDRVVVLGKVTRLNRKCDQTGFEPTLTIKRVNFLPPRAAQAGEPEAQPQQAG
jgi:hypothetical protein